MRVNAVAVLLVAIVFSFGADAPDSPQKPKSLAAVQAIARSDSAIKKAEAIYQATKLVALKQLVIDLKAAQGQAMKAGSLEEATAIKGEIDAAESNIALIAMQSQVNTFTIRADRDWQPTIEVKAGMTLEITAEGKWTHSVQRPVYDADGWPGVDSKPNTQNYGKLMGRVGRTEFLVGKRGEVAVTEDGMLMFRMKDIGTGDNAGQLRVQIDVK